MSSGRPNNRFCSTVSQGNTEPCCVMSTPLRFGALRGVPSTSTAPSSGARNPAMMFMSVVLPQPDGPTIATNSPSRTSKFNPSMTSSRPFSVAKPLLTFRIEIFGALVGVAPVDALMGVAPVGALMGISPPHVLHPLQQSHDAVERETDEPDDDH